MASQKFLLYNPRHTVPAIQQALDTSIDNRIFLAKLILATSQAVNLQLEPEIVKLLTAIVGDSKIDSGEP